MGVKIDQPIVLASSRSVQQIEVNPLSSTQSMSQLQSNIRVARLQKHIAMFMTVVSNLLPSNRFRDWLCDHAAFADRGYTLSVLTGGDGSSDDTIDSVCGVPVVRFACLSLTHAAQYNSEEPEHTFNSDDDIITALRSYLQSSGVDVVIATNTFGDPQTSLLLNVIHQLRTTTPLTGPLVLMDLPNLGIPKDWNDKVDGFIAPSRATGLHTATVTHGELPLKLP